MSQPTPYERKYDLTNDDGQDLRTQLDIELDDVARCFLETLTNLALIQRDDGQLANKSVGVEQLKAELIAGFNPPEPFQPFRLYEVSDSFVTDDGKWYIVNTAFTATADPADNTNDITLVYDFAAVRVDTIAAKDAAEAAQAAAELARDQAQTAQTGAETAQTAAEAAQSGAETAETGAINARNTAENARDAAELARDAAQLAETNAEAAEAAAQAAFDDFDDRYLGQKPSPPTVDNDGNALLEGAMYWDTSAPGLYVWDGAAWQANDVVALTQDASNVNVTTATGTQALADALDSRVITAISVAAVESLSPTGLSESQPLRLEDGGRSGPFRWSAADRSADVTADPLQGIYIAPSSDATGASGAWVRQYGQSVAVRPLVNPMWYGAVGDGDADDAPATQAAINTNGVRFPGGTFYCASSVSLPSGEGFYMEGSGFSTQIKMAPTASFGWDGTNDPTPLSHFKLKDVSFTSDVRATSAPIVRFISDGSFEGTPGAGSDFYRFEFDNVRINGTDRTGNSAVGLSMLGGYIGTFTNLIIQQVDLGLKIDQAPNTSYGGNAYTFTGGEIQGVNKIHEISDSTGIIMNMTLEGSDAGAEWIAPNDGIEIGGYFETNGRDAATPYDIRLSDNPTDSAQRNTNFLIKPSTIFKDGSGNKDHAILVENCVGFQAGGRFVGYAGSAISNISTSITRAIGFAENVIDDFEDWSNAGSPAIDKETSFFYWKEKSTYQDVTEVNNSAGVDTALATHVITAGGFHNRVKPLRIKFMGDFRINAENKNLKIRVNGTDLSEIFWNQSNSGTGFTITVDIIPITVTAQYFSSTIEGSDGTNPKVRTDETAINSLTTDITITLVGNAASGGSIVKRAMIVEKQ